MDYGGVPPCGSIFIRKSLLRIMHAFSSHFLSASIRIVRRPTHNTLSNVCRFRRNSVEEESGIGTYIVQHIVNSSSSSATAAASASAWLSLSSSILRSSLRKWHVLSIIFLLQLRGNWKVVIYRSFNGRPIMGEVLDFCQRSPPLVCTYLLCYYNKKSIHLFDLNIRVRANVYFSVFVFTFVCCRWSSNIWYD